ncbi:MAG: porin [Gemmatimonadales bacterium]
MRSASLTLLAVLLSPALPSALIGQSPDTLAAHPPLIALPKLGGYLQVRESWQRGAGVSAVLNRARLSAEGSLPGHFAYRLMAEFAATSSSGPSGVSLRDAYLTWTRSALTVTAGQFKTPYSREYLTSLTMIETADRSAVVDGLATKRDIGLMAGYSFGTVAVLQAGLFNSEGQNSSGNRDSLLLGVGRLAMRVTPALTVAANTARYADSTRYGVDASVELGRLVFRGEYHGQHRDAGGADDQGWFVLGAVRVAPWIQLVIRQEDFQRPAIAATARNRATTLGSNFEFGAARVRVLANYVSRRIGGTRRGSLVTQAQVRF